MTTDVSTDREEVVNFLEVLMNYCVFPVILKDEVVVTELEITIPLEEINKTKLVGSLRLSKGQAEKLATLSFVNYRKSRPSNIAIFVDPRPKAMAHDVFAFLLLHEVGVQMMKEFNQQIVPEDAPSLKEARAVFQADYFAGSIVGKAIALRAISQEAEFLKSYFSIDAFDLMNDRQMTLNRSL